METKINDISKFKEQLQTERELNARYMSDDRYFVGKFESKELAENFIRKTYKEVDTKAIYFYMLRDSLCYMFSFETGSSILGEVHQYEILKIDKLIVDAINYGVALVSFGADNVNDKKFKLSNTIQEYLHMELLDMYYKISDEELSENGINMSIPLIKLKDEVK